MSITKKGGLLMPECRLLAFPPIPLTVENVLYSNAEVLTDIAEFDEGVMNGAGYGKFAKTVLNNGIFLSNKEANKTMPGGSVGLGSKWVFDPANRYGYEYRKYYRSYTEFKLSEECYQYKNHADYTKRGYYAFKSKIANNLNNTPPEIDAGDTAEWEQLGKGSSRKYTRTDISEAFITGESCWDASQRKAFTAIDAITSDANKLPGEALNVLPTVSDNLLSTLESDWTQIGVINPLRVFEPSATMRTVRDLNLTFELSLDFLFEDFGLFSLSGDNVQVTAWNSSDQIVHDEDYNLKKPVFTYKESYFGKREQETQVVIRNIPWDVTTKVRIEITGTGECGVGQIHPSTAVSLGRMDYSPSIKYRSSTQQVKSDYVESEKGLEFYEPKSKVSYKSLVDPDELDLINDRTRSINNISGKAGLATYFEGTGMYRSFKYLGYMTDARLVMDNSVAVKNTIEIEGAL